VKNITNAFHSGRAVLFLMIFICCIIALAVLKITASVILPITIAILLACTLFPIIKWLDRRRVPRFISILLVVIILAAGLYILTMVLYTSGSNILSLYPKYENRLTEIYIFISNIYELPYDESLTFWENIWGQLGIRTWVRNFAFSFSNIFFKFISNAVLVVLFIVFILMEAGYFKNKLEAAFNNRSDRIFRMGQDVISQITRYLTAKFFISLATGIITSVGLFLIGVEFAIVWGVIAFILNFIPVLGSIVAGVGTSIFALAQFWPEPVPVILTVALILTINMVIGNFLDPKIIGEHVGISPLMVLVSLSIWGYIWGFAGAILAVPMTVIIKIICENIPIMEPVSILIGSKKAALAKIAEQEKTEELL
jgi:predicted PurR-regulated permease PerM